MSRIGDLKDNEKNKVNLVKIFELFCENETKYVEMFLKLYKNHYQSFKEDIIYNISLETEINIDKLNGLTECEIQIISYLMRDDNYKDFITDFKKFIQYNQKNLIVNNDLHKFESFAEVKCSVNQADEVEELKELERQIKRIHEDNEWLILIPLTYESSKKYGSNTKWCTASESISEHYNSYTNDGLLIYIINKGKSKYAVYKKMKNNEISFWDETDKRVDSIQTNIPNNIMEIIKTALNEELIILDSKELNSFNSSMEYITINQLIDANKFYDISKNYPTKHIDDLLNSNDYLTTVRNLMKRIG